MTSELKKQALASLKGKWGYAVGSTFLFSVLTTIASYILFAIFLVLSWPFQNADSQTFPLIVLYILYVIAILYVSSIFALGIISIYLGIAKGESASVSDLFTYFRGWKKTTRAFSVTFFLSLYTLLWSLLLIIPGIIKSFSYAMTYFILLEHPEFTVHQAISESKKIMKGHKWELFVLLLSFIGWYILALITFGIGQFWLLPYGYVTVGHFYEKISKEVGTTIAS